MPLLLLLVLWVLGEKAYGASILIDPGSFGSGKPYVRCTFDGVEQRCFLDTGSAMTLIPPKGPFARSKSSGQFRYKSASGKVHEAEVIQVRSVILDGRNVGSARIGRATRAEESILGMDILGRAPFAAEFKTAPKLQVGARLKKGERSDLEVLKSGLLAVPVTFGDQNTTAVWDTGASVTAVDAAFVRANANQFKPLGRRLEGVDGTGETVAFEVFRARQIRVGARTFKNVHVVVLDLTPLRENVGKNVNAVLGFNVIRRADWWFDRQAKRWSNH